VLFNTNAEVFKADNGKTLTQVVQESALGGYATTAEASLLIKDPVPRGKNAPTPALGPLLSPIRSLFISETREDCELDTELVRKITDGKLNQRDPHDKRVKAVRSYAKVQAASNCVPKFCASTSKLQAPILKRVCGVWWTAGFHRGHEALVAALLHKGWYGSRADAEGAISSGEAGTRHHAYLADEALETTLTAQPFIDALGTYYCELAMWNIAVWRAQHPSEAGEGQVGIVLVRPPSVQRWQQAYLADSCWFLQLAPQLQLCPAAEAFASKDVWPEAVKLLVAEGVLPEEATWMRFHQRLSRWLAATHPTHTSHRNVHRGGKVPCVIGVPGSRLAEALVEASSRQSSGGWQA
jgi:hypothetical protein